MQQPPRSARIAATSAFATNGGLLTSLFVRYAEVQQALDLGSALFGLIVAGFALGAAGAFHVPGVVLRRLGSRWTTLVGTAEIALALVVAAIAVTIGNPWLFMAALILAGLGDVVVDVAQNAQGLRVQGQYGRSVLSSMHAGWSVGAVIGGGLGTAAAAAGIPLLVHLAAWGAICVAAVGWAGHHFVADAPREAEEGAPGRFTFRAGALLLPVVLVALAGFSIEDVGNNWSAILLATERDMPVAAAGIGLTTVLAAQFVGRLLGDPVITRLGARNALLVSLGTCFAGLTLAAWAPSAALTLVGFAVAGLGSSITVPLAWARADTVPGLRPHAGVTWVSWAMRVASIGLTPAVGGLAALTSLPLALTGVALLAVAAFIFQTRAPSGT